tara:strand:- start:783 stop:3266 length:2484 start_codon:yes stop_codon:yes gene_type:complete
MHEGVWLTVLGLFGLMTIAVLILPLSRKVKMPYTVLLAVVGIVIGFFDNWFGISHSEFGIFSQFFQSFSGFELTSEIIFFIFLPVLIFEASLAIDVRKLLSDIRPILFLAVVGLFISSFLIGGAVYAVSGMGFVVCLLLGAILSATDPVAVVAIFKDLGAPKRLAILVEGESLFNDATAIVLFTILAAMVAGSAEADLASGSLQFIKVFVGGIVVGYIMARIFSWVIGKVGDIALVEVSLTISLAYLAFLVAEHYLHVSGVMAVVTAALVIGSHGRTSVSGHGWELLEETWETLGFWANSLIFILVGIAVPTILAAFGPEMWLTLVTLLVVGFGARALLTHGILPILSYTGICPPVNLGFRTVMWWGGLRGAVSLALALAVFENQAVPPEVRNFVVALVCAFVLFTLFINATTVGAVMKAFGLDKLSSDDLAIRDRTVEKALAEITSSIPDIAENNTIFGQVAEQAVNGYRNRLSLIKKAVEGENTIDPDGWLKIGLLSVIGQERKHYFSDYAKAYVDPSNTRDLVAIADELLDAVKVEGVEGYQKAWERTLGFDWRVRFAMNLQRKFSIVGPLRNNLSDRWTRLRSMLSALTRIKNNGIEDLQALIEPSVTDRLRGLLEERISKTEAALNALRKQYPEYADQVQIRHLDKITLHQELSKYKDLYDDSIISTEIYVSLETDLKARERLASEEPELDLGLDRLELVSAVPLFKDIDQDKRRSIADLLRPQLIVPGETLCRAGEQGDSMFFISSGAVAVQLATETLTLGSGEFVGEMALLNDAPRTATVVAESFCEVLVLRKAEFLNLLASNPVMKEAIEKVAEQRAIN